MSDNYFSPTLTSFSKLFTPGMTYQIPAYQRPYSWECTGKSDRNNQINRMWEDLWTFFKESDEEKRYFMGSMVVIADRQQTFNVVDGQQRLTSVLLLFSAFRCFLQQVQRMSSSGGASGRVDEGLTEWIKGADQTLEGLLFNKAGLALTRTTKVRIERAAGFDYDPVLNATMSCAPSSDVIDRLNPKFRHVASRYFLNRDYFIDRLRENFLEDGSFTQQAATQLDAFFSFLLNRVMVVQIETRDFDTAFNIFGILNNRGLPLSSLDLLRNLVLRELTQAKHPDPPEIWDRLEQDYALREDFLGRWFESREARKQQYSAFNDLEKLYRDTYQDAVDKPAILAFVHDMEAALNFYSFIVEPSRIEDPWLRRRVTFIQAMGNERYSNDLLLALFSRTGYAGLAPSPGLRAVVQAYQRYLLAAEMLPGESFKQGVVFEAIKAINNRSQPFEEIAIALLNPSVEYLSLLLDILRGPIRSNEMARLLLAECVWAQDEASEDPATLELDLDKASVEHILPRRPKPDSNWLKEFSEEQRRGLTYQLGNMTLVTTRMNSSMQNSDFKVKQRSYRKTRLPITLELAAAPSITPAWLEERHERLLTLLLSSLGLNPT